MDKVQAASQHMQLAAQAASVVADNVLQCQVLLQQACRQMTCMQDAGVAREAGTQQHQVSACASCSTLMLTALVTMLA